MATITLTKCDNCGKERKEKEREAWLPIWVDGKGRVVLGAEPDSPVTSSKLDLCSHGCFHKRLDALLIIKRPGRPRGSKNRKQDEVAA
jgi:hypothetical protein